MSDTPELKLRTRERPGRFQAAGLCVVAILGGLGAAQWVAGQPGVPREAAFMAGIFVLAAFLWVTEALPLFATSLLVIGLELLCLANPGQWSGLGFAESGGPTYQTVLHAAASPVLVLFFGGFLLARAAVKERVDGAMSALLLRLFGESPAGALAGIMIVTALFSMWMSNTATTAMMITLILPLLAQMPAGEPFRRALVLAVPFAANIGGMGTPIASPPNAVAVAYLQQAGHPVGFLNWMLVAVPMVALMLAFTWAVLWRLHRPRESSLRLRARGERLTFDAWLVVGIFTVTVLLWMTDRWHGLPPAVVALLPAVLLTVTQIITRDDLKQIEWNVIILIAGGIALGAGIELTGLDRIVLGWLPLQAAGPVLLVLVLLTATMILSTFMSNTAAANLLLPIGLSAAALAGPAGGAVSPARIALTIALAASLSMALPVSTPPNAIAYGLGELRTRDVVVAGLIVGLAGAALMFLLVPLLMRLAAM